MPARSIVSAILSIMTIFSIPLAVPVTFSGSVRTTSGLPVQKARVLLQGTTIFTYTDSLGRFSFTGDVDVTSLATVIHSRPASPVLIFAENGIFLKTASAGNISAEVFSADGRSIVKKVAINVHQLQIPHLPHKTNAVRFLRVQFNENTYTWRILQIENQYGHTPHCIIAQNRSNRTASVTSALSVAAPGFKPDTIAVQSDASSNIICTLVQQTSDLRSSFQTFYEGCGIIKDISTSEFIELEHSKRIHILLFGEGYLESDLDTRKYEQDLDLWYWSVFNLDPLSSFREAFVIWKYPIGSNEHVNPNGTANTFFKIPLSGSAIGSGFSEVTSIVWNLLGSFPFSPAVFYPSGGRTNRLAKNVIVQFLVFDAQRGKAGYSGLATSLTNPASTNQRVNAAFAQDQHHEFMHAFALLYDEYYDEAHTPFNNSSLRQESAYISNVVSSANCDSVPWKHLLYLNEHNTISDSLIGAFGTNGRYHPEFKCLMNGAHDNGVLYGGNNNLRIQNRMCNWCRELTLFRLYERCMVLSTTASSWQSWVESYREAFYIEFPFFVPSVVPQKNSLGTSWFLSCTN